jgi:hypothetical protein
VQAFLQRPIEGDWPYLWLDATDVKVREQGRIISVAVTIAVGVNSDGRREVLTRPGSVAACISCATPSHTPARASAASSGQARRYMSLETLGTISDTLLSVCPLWQPDCAAHAARKHYSYTMGWDTIVPLEPQSSKPLVSRLLMRGAIN